MKNIILILLVLGLTSFTLVNPFISYKLLFNVNKKELLPEKMNTIKVYGLLPTVEFQKVKCCAEVIDLFSLNFFFN